MAKEPVVCNVCQSVHFMAARRIFRVPVEGGGVDRNWGGSDSYANYLQCFRCGTNYVWNTKTLVYDQQPPGVSGIARLKGFEPPPTP